jgi:hypothetical protein
VETNPSSELKTVFMNRYLICKSVAFLCTLKCTFTQAFEHSSVSTMANVFQTLAMRIRLTACNLDGCHSIFNYIAKNAETFSTVSKSAYPNHRQPALTVLEKPGIVSAGDVSKRYCSCRLPPYQIIIPKCPIFITFIEQGGITLNLCTYTGICFVEIPVAFPSAACSGAIRDFPHFDMDMSYTRVLHIKVAYRVPHK